MTKLFRYLSIAILGVALTAAPLIFTQVLAQDDDGAQEPVRIDFFERDDCGHCQDEKAFFEDLSEIRNDFIVVGHDIMEDPQARADFNALTELKGLPKVTPLTIVGGVVVQGFGTAETTGQQIISLIEKSKGQPQMTFEEFMRDGAQAPVQVGGETCPDDGCDIESFMVDIPFVGQVDISQYSLPILSLVLGFVDGFNPCAMWVLVLFLTILMEAGSRRRMFEMAGLFILAEAIMYYLILNVWMTAWDWVGLDAIVTPIVGTVAVAAGCYFLYNFYKADTTCKVGDLTSKKRTTDKIRHYATTPMTFITALGVLGLAFSVNIIEFACSIGIPQTFTKILDLNYLTWAGKQFYNALYILMYMVDDLVVFGLALYSFEKIGLTTSKYTRASHLIGGLIMVILGAIMLVRPSLLVL